MRYTFTHKSSDDFGESSLRGRMLSLECWEEGDKKLLERATLRTIPSFFHPPQSLVILVSASHVTMFQQVQNRTMSFDTRTYLRTTVTNLWARKRACFTSSCQFHPVPAGLHRIKQTKNQTNMLSQKSLQRRHKQYHNRKCDTTYHHNSLLGRDTIPFSPLTKANGAGLGIDSQM